MSPLPCAVVDPFVSDSHHRKIVGCFATKHSLSHDTNALPSMSVCTSASHAISGPESGSLTGNWRNMLRSQALPGPFADVHGYTSWHQFADFYFELHHHLQHFGLGFACCDSPGQPSLVGGMERGCENRSRGLTLEGLINKS